jgi:peptidoglycan lytic transglycosylase D
MVSRCGNLLASRHGVYWAVLLIVAGCVLGAANAFGAARAPFPCPGYLQPRVGFWVEVFSRYSSRDFIVHDRDKVWRVYGVMHLPGVGDPTRAEIASTDRYLENKYQRVLESLAAGEQPPGRAASKVAAMFHEATRAELRAAASNLGVQRGLSAYFMRGIIHSERYRRMMQRIFVDYGLPPRLVFLAAVESNFNPRARSAAHAVGIWQFVASTGRHYMHISRHRDDRLNPARATIAAAKLLRSNYQMLGSWPLAITAYNYGTQGMARAASEYGGNYRQILEHWDGPTFGFAVKNYYAEFLAALRIYENQGQYFPGLPEPGNLPVLVADRDATQAPADHDEARAAARDTAAQRCTLHRGETLYAIAHRYGVTLASLMRINRIDNARRLRAGRVLLIPQAGITYAREELKRYRVRAGDTLYAIAQRAGIALSKLVAINQVENPRSLNVGAILLIPAS